MSHWQFLEATLCEDVVRHVIQPFNMPNRNRARKHLRKCFSQIHSFHEERPWTKTTRECYRRSVKCRHSFIFHDPNGACPCGLPQTISRKIKFANYEHHIEVENARTTARQLVMHRLRSQFDVAIKPYDIRGICRYDVWKEWESQGCPPISVEWIQELVANRYVQFVFKDLSCFNQLKASSYPRWVEPRLYHVPILYCVHIFSRRE